MAGMFAISAVALCLVTGLTVAEPTSDTPELVLKSYLRANYARNSEAAYALLSEADKSVKALDTYREQNGSFSGQLLQLSEELAKAIVFKGVTVSTKNNRATVSFSVDLPDANSPKLKPIVEGFNKERFADPETSGLKDRLL